MNEIFFVMYLEFKDERDRDFIDNYFAVLSEKWNEPNFLTKEEIFERTINREAKRFYVSYEQAYRVISMLMRKKEVRFKNKFKRKMYLDLLKRVKEIRRKKRLSLGECVWEAIYSPAPCFYMSANSARVLLYNLLNSR